MKKIIYSLFICLFTFIFWKESVSLELSFLHACVWFLFSYFLWKTAYYGLLAYGLFTYLILSLTEYFQFSADVISYGYSALVFFLSSAYILISQKVSSVWNNVLKITYWFCCSLVLFVPLMFMLYYVQFGTAVTNETLYALFQTNRQESFDYINDFISVYLLVLLAVTIGGSWFFIASQKVKKTRLLLPIIILVSSAFFLAISPPPALPKMFWEAVKTYKQELVLFNKTASEMAVNNIPIEAFKKENGETHIVVIGESLHKNHMSLYGYPRKTTPKLDSLQFVDGFILFNNAYANHTHTIEVLKLSLTEANQYNQKEFYESLSILDMLNASNNETYWISNQNLKGAWDNVVGVIAERSNHLLMINASIGKTSKMQHFDGQCIEEIKRIVNTPSKKNKVIFVHLMGSHSPYDSRYPRAEFRAFREAHQGDVGFVGAQIKNLSDYDNSILYNDYVVGSILELLQSQKGANSFFYLSDHADDVLQQKGHNSGSFTYEMTEVPMMSWMSEEYRNKYTATHQQLLKNQNKWYSNDLLFNTLLGVFQIESPKYDSKFDLTSANYQPTDSSIKVLHNALYTADDNYIYWQKVNIDYLIKNKLHKRVYPHRINSIAKLQQVWKSGMRSFELDVFFEKDSVQRFRVGHHKGKMGRELEVLLNSINHYELQNIWIDFKNLNKKNAKAALNELERLDDLFNIKEKALIESNTDDAVFSLLSQYGWKTSYYLPTSKVLDLMSANNKEGLSILSKDISQQILDQKVSAISFDDRLYPFVKNHLENLISKEIAYHCWYGPELKSPSFETELKNNPLFKDRRVHSLLSPYYSLFHL